MTKIVKWELFFVFDDGSRESMWEVTRKKGKNLLQHEQQEIGRSHGPEFVMVKTYADGRVVED